MKERVLALGLIGVMTLGMSTAVMADPAEGSVTCDVTLDSRALALETKVLSGSGITGAVTTFEDVVVTDLDGNGKIDMVDALKAASADKTKFSYTVVDSTYGAYVTEIGGQGPDVTNASLLLKDGYGYIQSGWMGSKNDVYPSVSLGATEIADKDDLEFRFTITGSYDIATGGYIPGPNNDYPSLDLKFIDLVEKAKNSSDADTAEIGQAYYDTIAASADANGYTSSFFQMNPIVDEIDGLEALMQ